RLHVQSIEQRAKKRPRPSAVPRLLVGLLFLVSAVVAWRARHKAPDIAADSGGRWWKRLAIALLLACLWELPGVENWLGSEARAMARAEDVYYSRAVFQKAMTSTVIVITAMFLVRVWRRARKSRRLLYASLALYLGLSTVAMLS